MDDAGAGYHLFLWAEDPETMGKAQPSVVATDPAPARGDRKRPPKPPSHPGQLPIGSLRALLAAEPFRLTGAFQPANTTVWLPTLDGLPLTRRGLFSSNGEGARNRVSTARSLTARPSLYQWQITGLTLEPITALHFLARLSNTAQPVQSQSAWHVRQGNDLLFWSSAAKFALEILVGQHYLPSLRAESGGSLEAVWQPILLDPRIEQRRERLVAIMPPVCRAYNIADPADAPAAATLTEQFVATLVDAAIRAWAKPVTLPDSDLPARAWLRQLLAPQPQLRLPPQPAHALFQGWQQWTEQIFVVRDANFRICFVLEEPDDADTSAQHAAWRLTYFLQARDNPNLMIPAQTVWQAPNNTVSVGGRHVDRPQERLLAGLGVAGRLFAPIERSLHNPRPEMSLLSTQEAYRFLREIGPLLESSGFGVVLPGWWQTSGRMRLGLRLRLADAEETDPSRQSARARADADRDPDTTTLRNAPLLGLNSLINFSWELVLGGESLSAAEFAQLAAMHTPLLRVGGRWVELEPQQVDAAKRFLNEQRSVGATTLLQAIRVAQEYRARPDSASDDATPAFDSQASLPAGLAPPGDATDLLPLDSVAVSGILEATLELLRAQQPPAALREPPGFVGELRAYQRRGVGWLAHLRRLGLGACLADDMGLGKTIQAIALLLHVRSEALARGDKPAPALLICPTSVVANWRREIERFAPMLTALVHHGNNRLAGDNFHAALTVHDLVITSYGTARRDIELLQPTTWSNLILDEAQNIKTPSAKQTQAVRRLRADNRIALTGTPVENRLSELWSIMEFLNPGYLGHHETFRRRYIVPIERYNDQERASDLRALVQPFLLRRLKSDPTIISDLPEKNEMVVYCSLTREQAALYEQLVQAALADLTRTDGIQRRGLVLALLTKLKQIANHPAHYLKQEEPLAGRSGKLNRLTEMLEEALAVGDRALIFTQFVEMGHLIQRHLDASLGVESLFLHGSTPAPQRDKMVQAFQSDDGPPLFILSLRAGGSGLNLTRANHVFHFDRWWNPAVENQATDRAFRIGQLRNVQVHKFVVAGTLEERIHDLIESKQALAQTIVGSGEEWLTELDTEQLRDLLMLRYDAIEDD